MPQPDALNATISLPKSSPLAGQTAVVTGAARGIGRAIAERLAILGASLVLIARDQSALHAVESTIAQQGGSARSIPCDLLDDAAIDRLATDVRRREGRCDILVNCAGIGELGKPLHLTDPASFDRTLGTNLRAPYLLIRAFAPLMIERQSGHVVNISSLAGKNPLPNGAAYAASKWALNGLTYSVAEELRQHHIRVSAVAPGSVNTHFGSGGSDDAKAARKLQPSDVADVVALLVQQPPQSFVSEVLMRPTTKP
jgi:NAD(P)-dependent dehydrogenase (short-subunit alcohol dehydrogenase family)